MEKKTMQNVASDIDKAFLEMAHKLAAENAEKGFPPFGAVIVRGGKVISTGVDSRFLLKDPTEHAVINAIRNACQDGQTDSLEGCIVYSSAEPCPMCVSALYLSGVKKIFYNKTEEEANRLGFTADFIYNELGKRPENRAIPCIKVDLENKTDEFDIWDCNANKVEAPY